MSRWLSTLEGILRRWFFREGGASDLKSWVRVVLLTGALTVASGAVVTVFLRSGASNSEALSDGSSRNSGIMFAGDSLTSGYFASSESATFAAQIGSHLGDPPQKYAALADQTLTTVSRVVDVPGDLDVALVELGTNDVSQGTDLAEFEDQYRALIDRIREKSPTARLVCMGTWTDSGAPYDQVIERQCGFGNGRYVRLSDLYSDESNRGPAGIQTVFGVSDNFHPNDQGHRAIADRVEAVLATL